MHEVMQEVMQVCKLRTLDQQRQTLLFSPKLVSCF